MHALLRPAGDQMFDTGKSIPAPLLKKAEIFARKKIFKPVSALGVSRSTGTHTSAPHAGVPPRTHWGQCELAHNRLRFFRCRILKSRRVQAMIQQPAKRIPQWLAIDVLIILVSLAIIGIGIWIAP